MTPEGVQKKLKRVRPLLVHISYDLQAGDAISLNELSFLLEVAGDSTTQVAESLPKWKEPRFVDVTPENFDSIFKNLRSRLAVGAEDSPSKDPSGNKE